MEISSTSSQIKRGARILIAVRTWLLEASWNNRGMQNLGFCFSILPGLKKLYSGKALLSALKRHLAVFNTNPHFSGFVAGAILQQEAQAGTDTGPEASKLERAKAMLGGAFGAVGDDLMWASLKPFLGALAVFLLIMGHWWAFLWFVIFFSVAGLAFRLIGVERGLKGIGAVQEYLSKAKPKALARMLKRSAVTLLGAILGVLLAGKRFPAPHNADPWLSAIPIVGMAFVCYALRVRKVSSDKIGAGICVLVSLAMLFGF